MKGVRLIRRGKRRGKEIGGYGKRWLAESFFSVFERYLGEYVSSARFESILIRKGTI